MRDFAIATSFDIFMRFNIAESVLWKDYWKKRMKYVNDLANFKPKRIK